MKKLSCAVLLGLSAMLVTTADASAQGRCRWSWQSSAADSRYTRQFGMDVGDIPGHQVRIYEIQRAFPDVRPNCERLKWIEEWNHGFSDYIDLNGRAWGYEVRTLENGDRIYVEYSGTSRTMVAPDGSKKSSFEGFGRWTGGTGKYQAVRGIEWIHIVFDPEKGVNEQSSDAEYWFEE